MTGNQHDIYKDAAGLDPEIECKGIDSLLNSNCGEKGSCSTEDYYRCKKEFIFDSLKFISAQMNTYEKALEEIKKGRNEHIGCGLFSRSFVILV